MKTSGLKVFLFCVLLTPLVTHAISRVGNGGVSSQVNAYTLTVPAPFFQVQLFPDEAARFVNATVFTREAPTIELLNFASEFSDLAGQQMDQIAQSLLKQDWQEVFGHLACGRVFFQQTADTMAYVAFWTPTQGYVLITSGGATSKNYLDEILSSTRLAKGICP